MSVVRQLVRQPARFRQRSWVYAEVRETLGPAETRHPRTPTDPLPESGGQVVAGSNPVSPTAEMASELRKMELSLVAHMFERCENCHKLSQLASNSRSNTLAAAIRRLQGMRSIPGKVPGVWRASARCDRGGRIASIVDPTISAVDGLQNSNVSGVGRALST